VTALEAQAEEVEELLSDVEELEGDVTEVADLADRPSSAAQD
jgi:methyl-accepting chemotaxis protein